MADQKIIIRVKTSKPISRKDLLAIADHVEDATWNSAEDRGYEVEVIGSDVD